MKTDDKKAMIQQYVDAYNRFDVEGMLSTLTEDVTFENVQSGEVNVSANGKTEFKALAEQAKALFAERQQIIERIDDGADLTAAKIAFSAKLASDLPNGMKAGEQLRMHGVSEFVFSDGKICSIRDIS
jgi:ketosteroid isomerase-like protein